VGQPGIYLQATALSKNYSQQIASGGVGEVKQGALLIQPY